MKNERVMSIETIMAIVILIPSIIAVFFTNGIVDPVAQSLHLTALITGIISGVILVIWLMGGYKLLIKVGIVFLALFNIFSVNVFFPQVQTMLWSDIVAFICGGVDILVGTYIARKFRWPNDRAYFIGSFMLLLGAVLAIWGGGLALPLIHFP